MHPTTLVALMVACAAVLVMVRGEEPGEQHEVSVAPRKIRSLYQACRKDIKNLCARRRGVLPCLEANVTQVEDDICATWLKARLACRKDVGNNPKCEKKSFRGCLMRMDEQTLSEACSKSEFYGSIKRTRRLINKRRREAGIDVAPKDGSTSSD